MCYLNFVDELSLVDKIKKENEELQAENKKLKALLKLHNINFEEELIEDVVLSTSEKIALYHSLFVGREDVFAEQYLTKAGKKGFSPICKNKFKNGCEIVTHGCKNCKIKEYLAYSDEAIEAHIRGEKSYGIYALTKDNLCKFVVADFDKDDFKRSALEFKKVASFYDIDVALEISQSGNGAHAWIFFDEFVQAKSARKIANFILEKCFENGENSDLDSFDRIIPNQEKNGVTGFSSLIALPLSGKCQKTRTTLFVNQYFEPYTNQFAYLSKVKRLSFFDVQRILGIIIEENKDNSFISSQNIKIDKSDFKDNFSILIGSTIEINKSKISKKCDGFFRKLGVIYNRTYFENMAKGLPTYGEKSRIKLYDENDFLIKLPRGVLSNLKEILDAKGIKYSLIDKRESGTKIDVNFNGTLRYEQELALDALKENENGILVAPTAFGKTILAIALISELKINTLILTDKIQLISQWKDKIVEFTNLDKKEVGEYHSTKKKLTGIIDISSLKSLGTENVDESIFSKYGLIIVDEVHHIGAESYFQTIKKFNAKYIFGLTATLKRSDGNEKIVTKAIGDVIFEAKETGTDFERKLHPIFTDFNFDLNLLKTRSNRVDYNELIKYLYKDNKRNELIVSYVNKDIGKRNILILTERVEHAEILCGALKNLNPDKEIKMINGSMTNPEKREFKSYLDSLKIEEKVTIISTGKFIGEGFDLERLDELFIALPIKWEGSLQQYVGRLHRKKDGKNQVDVYDFVDLKIPIFENMFNARLNKYHKLKYVVKTNKEENIIFGADNYFKRLLEDIKNAKNSISIFANYYFDKTLEIILNNAKVETLVYTNKDISFQVNENIKRINKKVLLNAVVIDENIIRHGSLNPFVFNKKEDENAILRIVDKKYSKILIDEVREDEVLQNFLI